MVGNRKLTEDQTLYLLKTQGINRPVQLAFGPSGVWLKDVPENAWAFDALREFDQSPRP